MLFQKLFIIGEINPFTEKPVGEYELPDHIALAPAGCPDPDWSKHDPETQYYGPNGSAGSSSERTIARWARVSHGRQPRGVRAGAWELGNSPLRSVRVRVGAAPRSRWGLAALA
eukprot:CAMPEP_0206231806 /NCGR_PEP_ID=MMETSP0047_2-20121206/11047_1 /ASSEMBLY_ACC=CAM_ASM_000192 /TAXON_ID=195065 /ORGANISM="Chroomonas mesostigmatica_cf, Strain CCMP1168" /LENGTH=113 /DNA_ID=CAMNT_0053655437 /DNA_START=26 /DNA_END=368 /DNA_ORIENTATION=-